MRLVTWNCNSTVSKKLEKLIELKPDVAVVQECEKELNGLPNGAEWQMIAEQINYVYRTSPYYENRDRKPGQIYLIDNFVYGRSPGRL